MRDPSLAPEDTSPALRPRRFRLSGGHAWAFALGALAGVSGLALTHALRAGRRLDPRLVRAVTRDGDGALTVVVPGILGSTLDHPDGHRVWLDISNALVWHDLRLPRILPVSAARDDLRPGPLVGLGAVAPRLFGFTEYQDLYALLGSAGSRPCDDEGRGPLDPGPHHCAATYDWRHDLAVSARRLGQRLEALAERCGDPQARFDLVAHSMGGLVARYYLRYGDAEPGPETPVTWAGARRIRQLVLVATPNEGSIDSLNVILNGSPVGLSYSTLSADVIAHTPSIYTLLPPAEVAPFVDEHGRLLHLDLFDLTTWERYGWGPYAPGASPRRTPTPRPGPDLMQPREHLQALLDRARAVRAALRQPPATPCPVPVVQLGGDCLLTLGRARLSERPGLGPRFVPETAEEAERMLEPGDGRVTRTSLLAAHLPRAADGEAVSGVPEVGTVFLGAADHHGLYAEPTFQNLLLRRLFASATRRPSPTGPAHVRGPRRSS